MSLFNQSRAERDIKIVKGAQEPADMQPRGKTEISTLASGMQVTGNIVCAGPLQIFGRVIGDIHASQLTIGEGAAVEGKIVAPETIIRGVFNGTVHGNVVKLQSTAVVEGEIFNRSLSIEQDARFEGVARRLDKAVEEPAIPQAGDEGAAFRAETAPALAG